MAQRYAHPIELERMEHNLCPECGMPEATHLDDIRFWLPRGCSLLPAGVRERIDQYRADRVTTRDPA